MTTSKQTAPTSFHCLLLIAMCWLLTCTSVAVQVITFHCVWEMVWLGVNKTRRRRLMTISSLLITDYCTQFKQSHEVILSNVTVDSGAGKTLVWIHKRWMPFCKVSVSISGSRTEKTLKSTESCMTIMKDPRDSILHLFHWVLFLPNCAAVELCYCVNCLSNSLLYCGTLM